MLFECPDEEEWHTIINNIKYEIGLESLGQRKKEKLAKMAAARRNHEKWYVVIRVTFFFWFCQVLQLVYNVVV